MVYFEKPVLLLAFSTWLMPAVWYIKTNDSYTLNNFRLNDSHAVATITNGTIAVISAAISDVIVQLSVSVQPDVRSLKVRKL